MSFESYAAQLSPIVGAIKFKKVILNLDIHSRKAILKKILETYNFNGNDELEVKCHEWIKNLYDITCEETEKEMRKHETKNSERWDDLFNILICCDNFMYIIRFIGITFS